MTQFQITQSRTWGHNLTATVREKPRLLALPSPLDQEEIREILTLQQALDRYLARCRLKGRSETTIQGYQDVINRHGRDWLDRTLDELGRSRRAFTARHTHITLNSGPTTANQFMRAFRAIYRHARRFDPDLPAPPTEVIEYNPEHRREKIITDWPGWLAAVQAQKNPIVRDWYLFLAFTGMRKTSAGAVRVRHVKLDRGFLHVPNPKGGTRRAFDLPLSRHLTEILAARIAENEARYPGSPWLFPSLWAAKGHLTQVYSRYLPSPHVHRHSYATGAKAAGLGEYDIKLLLNHKITDVTGRYLHASMLGAHLQACQEKVTAWLLNQMAPSAQTTEGPNEGQ